MKSVYLAIKTQLETVITKDALKAIGIDTEAPYIEVQLFENQFERLKESKQIPFSLPCCVVSFSGPNEWKQLGNGVQMLDPFYINIHICREFYDASTDNTSVAAGVINGQDLPMYDLKQLVYKALQEFEPDLCAKFVRFEEIIDEDMTMFNHFIQRYKSNLIDADTARPVDGIMSTPPYTLEETNNKL